MGCLIRFVNFPALPGRALPEFTLRLPSVRRWTSLSPPPYRTGTSRVRILINGSRIIDTLGHGHLANEMIFSNKTVRTSDSVVHFRDTNNEARTYATLRRGVRGLEGEIIGLSKHPTRFLASGLALIIHADSCPLRRAQGPKPSRAFDPAQARSRTRPRGRGTKPTRRPASMRSLPGLTLFPAPASVSRQARWVFGSRLSPSKSGQAPRLRREPVPEQHVEVARGEPAKPSLLVPAAHEAKPLFKIAA